MATTEDVADTGLPSDQSDEKNSWLMPVVWIVGLLIVGIGGGYVALSSTSQSTDSALEEPILETVERGELLVSITEEGNVESASNIELKCEIAGGSSILWIIEDGVEVKKGEKLAELDAAALEDQISQQKITFENARSAVIQAEKNLEVAKISVKEYIDGTFKKEQQDAEANITIALENLRTAQNSLEHAERMFRKGYISPLELESQQFGVQRAQLELDSMNTAKEVLENFTKVKTLEDLESQVETAEAALKAQKAAFQLEVDRLARLEEQIAKCTIIAPQDGMVVYANNRSGRGRGSSTTSTVELGAAVRERQDIFKLPDLSQMQVKVTIHESKVDSLRPGLPARITILDRRLRGEITNVANQPEPPTSFFGSSSIKYYAATVQIEGQEDGLKPGMTATVEIFVAQLRDVIKLPVEAVCEQKPGEFCCWVQDSSGKRERRTIELGMTNDTDVEIKSGVSEGDVVIVNPRAVVPEAREFERVTEDINIEETFGDIDAQPEAPEEPRGRRPDGGQGGAERGGDGGERRGGGGGERRGGGERGGGGGGGGGGSFLDRMDADGDGRVSLEEAPDRMKDRFPDMDLNGDGFIDAAEMEERQRSRGGGGGGGGGFGGGGGGGGFGGGRQ